MSQNLEKKLLKIAIKNLNYRWQNGIFLFWIMNYLKWHKQDTVHLLLVAPQIIRKRIFEELHSQTYSGHLRRDSFCKSVNERFLLDWERF